MGISILCFFDKFTIAFEEYLPSAIEDSPSVAYSMLRPFPNFIPNE